LCLIVLSLVALLREFQMKAPSFGDAINDSGERGAGNTLTDGGHQSKLEPPYVSEPLSAHVPRDEDLQVETNYTRKAYSRSLDVTEGLALEGASGDNATGYSAVTSSTTPHDIFSPAWVKNEALYLLERIQQHGLTSAWSDRSKALLAGYEFGGIVVKQVMPSPV
jgi:hypothetical protein